jgi:hypothetical protein
MQVRIIPFDQSRRRWPAAFAVVLLLGAAADKSSKAQDTLLADIAIYGATPAGIVASIRLKELGHSVLLLEPSRHVGGMTTGGLGATDIGNKQAIGGMARQFYQRIYQYYQSDVAWRFQKRDQYKGTHQRPGETSQWTFEPQAARVVFQTWMAEHGIQPRLDSYLDRSQPLKLTDGRIGDIRLTDGTTVRARYYMDATYEGDLMAQAGVDFTLGRESNDQYGESLNGVQFAQAKKHQFLPGISPYRVAGDAASGLLPGIASRAPQSDGTADRLVQAYCLRMTLTDAPENRIEFQKPDGYREEDYELLFRQFEGGLAILPWHSIGVPNRKTDTNNNTGFSTDMIDGSHLWAQASYDQRQAIFQKHWDYQRGLVWSLANHPRVPEKLRREAARWGTSRDEFESTQGWSPQLYVREARRLVGAMVMNERHCRGQEVCDDSVGMAAYTMDSHNVQRVVGKDGYVQNEGDVQVGGFPPYPISYRSLIPKESQCTNLVVPVCLSASHIAYGSIRMEPVFMVLGQSSAEALHLALREGVGLPSIRYERLRERLLDGKQVLTLAVRP